MVIDAAPSPSIASSADAGKIWVRTGVYGELDGSVMALNLQTFETEVVLTEAELGQDITSISGSPSGFVALSVDADWRYGVRCMDEATGVQVQGMQTDSFLSDVAIDDRGRVFITAREGWSDDGSVAPGLHVLDSQTCQPALSAPIQTTLDPYTVSFF